MVLRFLWNLGLVFLVIFLILALAPIEPELNVKYHVPRKAPEFLGPLTPNSDLNSAEKLFSNQVIGPEAIAVGKDNAFYSGLSDGRIVRMSPTTGKVETIVRIGGKKCDADPKKNTCGHPLGVRFDLQGFLNVADCVKGIYKVNVTTGAVVPIVKNTDVINGKPLSFADDLTIAKSGDIYFTDVGSTLGFDHVIVHAVEHVPYGRVLRYNAKTKEVTVMVENLYMPNGIQLTPQEDALIICQTFEHNLLKFHLKGPKKGQLEVFADNLPGFPDNIRLSPRNTYWVGLAIVRLPNKVMFGESLGPHPLTRKAFYRGLIYLSEISKYLNQITSFEVFDLLNQEVIRCFEATLMNRKYGLMLEVSADGQILRSFHSPDGSRTEYSHIAEHENVLYLGSPWNNYVGKLKL